MSGDAQTCSISGCSFDKAYAIVKDGKVYRITFSKSLADLISKKTGYEVKRVKLFMEDITDDTTLFAICKKESGWPLRITFFKQCMNLWKSDSTVFKGCKIQIIN